MWRGLSIRRRRCAGSGGGGGSGSEGGGSMLRRGGGLVGYVWMVEGRGEVYWVDGWFRGPSMRLWCRLLFGHAI